MMVIEVARDLVGLKKRQLARDRRQTRPIP